MFEAGFHLHQSHKLSQCHRENSMKLDIWVIVIGLFLCFCLQLWHSSFYEIGRDRVTSRISVLLLILSVWFSLDHVSLCFWLHTTPTTTPSQVKTSLQSLSLGLAIVISLWKLDKFYVMQQNKQEINYKSIQPT